MGAREAGEARLDAPSAWAAHWSMERLAEWYEGRIEQRWPGRPGEAPYTARTMSGSRGDPQAVPIESGGVGAEPRGGRSFSKAYASGVPTPTGLPTESVGRGNETEAHSARRNHHRALALAGLVGLVPGVLVAVVLVLAGQAVAAVASLVVVAGGTAWWTWRSAPGRVARAVGAWPERRDRPSPTAQSGGRPVRVDGPFPPDHLRRRARRAQCHGRGTRRLDGLSDRHLRPRASTLPGSVEGVLAHELVHVKRGQIALGRMAAVALAPWSVVVGVARAGDQVHALVGPGREFTADQRAAAVVRYPPGIGSALEVMAGRPGPPAAWPPGRAAPPP